MEKLEYCHLVQTIIKAHRSDPIEDEIQESESEEQLIIDTLSNHYLLMTVGWDGERREYETLIHLDIKDGKIWIQSDGTEVGIANELLEAGVPPEDIILGFKSPFKRQLMGYEINSKPRSHFARVEN